MNENAFFAIVYNDYKNRSPPYLITTKIKWEEKIMSFIKYKEESKWKKWKYKEESLLRIHGMDENLIQELYEYDWLDFKRSRSFLEHQTVSNDLIQINGESVDTYAISDIRTLIDQIEDSCLYDILSNLDPTSLIIVFMKYQGYSSKEISKYLHITVRSIDCKLYRLRKKYKARRDI